MPVRTGKVAVRKDKVASVAKELMDFAEGVKGVFTFKTKDPNGILTSDLHAIAARMSQADRLRMVEILKTLARKD